MACPGAYFSAKVSDLLKARSGVYVPAAYETAAMKARRPERGSYEPGTHWNYNNWDFNVLATIYNQETAGDLFRAFETNFAVPLQMQDFAIRHTYYHREPEHSRHPAYPFRMSARDLARFGLLFLNQGKWKDRQIVPADWVQESTTAYSTYSKGGYGYMWWTLPKWSEPGKLGAYAVFGYGGHSIYIVPGANLVFVHRADTYQGKRKHVSSTSVWNMLQAVLKARTTPPMPSPKLITADASPVDATGQSFSKAQFSRLSGEYFKDNFMATVREQEGQLEVTSPRWGNYFLYPETETMFVAEDAHKKVEFVLDATRNAIALKIWFSADEPYEMRRLSTQD